MYFVTHAPLRKAPAQYPIKTNFVGNLAYAPMGQIALD
jgi:hypothetical protein